MTDEPAIDISTRRKAALRGCERVLSHGRPLTLRERLARLQDQAEKVYDLGDWMDMYGDGVVAAFTACR